MPIQFPIRDLTFQNISSSYQNVVQRYDNGPTQYLLDGLGYSILSIQSASLGKNIITTGQTASYALVSVLADVALLADTASISVSSEFSISASFASFSISASWAPTGPGGGTTLVTGSTYPVTSSWAESASFSQTASYVSPDSFNNLILPLEFVFKSSTSAADPGSKNFKYDASNTSSITQIYVSSTTNGGIDISAIINNLHSGSTQIYIQQKQNSGQSSLFDVTSTPVDNSGWFTIPVNHITSSIDGLPTNNKSCVWIVINKTAIIPGNTYPITSSWTNNAQFANQSIQSTSSLSASYVTSSNVIGTVTNATNAGIALTASFITSSGLNGILTVPQGGTGLNTIPATRIPFGFNAGPLLTDVNFRYNGGILFAPTIVATGALIGQNNIIVGNLSGFTAPFPLLTIDDSGNIVAATASVDYITPTQGTASWSQNAVTASFAMNAGGGSGTTLFTGSTYPITSSFSISSSLSTTASHFNFGVVRLVKQNGNILEFYGSTDVARGNAIFSALTASVSGDTIYVHGNANISNPISKDGVNWWFDPNTTITFDSSGVSGFIFDDSSNVSGMSFTIGGNGKFHRKLVGVSGIDPFTCGVLKVTNISSSINFNFNNILYDNTASIDGELSPAVYLANGLLTMTGEKFQVVNNSENITPGFFWWAGGTFDGYIKEVVDDQNLDAWLLWSAVDVLPAGEFNLSAETINCRYTWVDGGQTQTARIWITAKQIYGLGQVDFPGKVYVSCEKYNGVNLSRQGEFYLTAQKVGGVLPLGQGHFLNQGGYMSLNVDRYDLDPTTTVEILNQTSGSTFIESLDIVAASGSDAFIVRGGTLNLLSGRISSSLGRFDIKNSGAGIVNVSPNIRYNSSKITGSISFTPVFGGLELGGIANLSSGSTGLIKRIGQGAYSIATASVDYLTPTGSLFGTSSWSNNAKTASFLLGSVSSASYASTASWALNVLTASFALTASSLRSGVVRLIRQNGQVVEFFGTTPSECGRGMVDAQAAAVSGDTIYVYGNASVTSSFGKNGVNWWFGPGSSVLRSDAAVGNIFDDNGTDISCSIMGHGHFERFIPQDFEIDNPGDAGVFKQTGLSSVIDFEFETIYLTDNGTSESSTTLFVGGGTCRPHGNRLFLTGSSSGGAGLWWENGEIDGYINEIMSDGPPTFLIYNHVSETPTGDLRLYVNKIDTGHGTGSVAENIFAIDNNVSHPDAAAWFFVNTIRGIVSSAGGKLYIIGQKLIGRAILGDGKTYFNLQKIGGNLSAPRPYVFLNGGNTWINVNQFEPGTNSRELISASFGNHFINAQDLTSSGSNAIAVGGFSSTVTLNLLSGIISSSGAGMVDLKRNNGTLNISSNVIYNSAKTSGSISLLPIYGTQELTGISNLSSGSTGLIKRTGQGTYTIATASVDYLTPTGSLFGTSSWALNAVTASFAMNAGGGQSLVTGSTVPITSSWALTASSLPPLLLDSGNIVTNTTQSNIVIIQRPTGSLNAAYFDYVIQSGSNSKAGTIFGSWITNSISYTQYVNADIGNTSQVTMSLFLTQSNVQLLANVSTTRNWMIKSIGRYI